MELIDYDNSEFLKNPYPVYRFYRENSPIYYHKKYKRWIVFSAPDIEALATHAAISSNVPHEKLSRLPKIARWLNADLVEILEHVMIFSDGDIHARLRKVSSKEFSRSCAMHLRPLLERKCKTLIGDMVGRTHADFKNELSYPLPILLACEFLGVEANIEQIKQASLVFMGFIAGTQVGLADFFIANRACKKLKRLLKCSCDQGGQAIALVDRIKDARTKGEIDDKELLSYQFIILLAGHITTVNQIANSIYSLANNPEQWALLKDKPALIDRAVDELMRFDGSVQAVPRVASKDFQYRDVCFRKGELIYLMTGSGNRDCARTRDPDRLDITRAHVNLYTLGWGRHFCPGSHIGKLEIKMVLLYLMEYFPNFKISKPCDQLEWHRMFSFRGLVSLPVTLI